MTTLFDFVRVSNLDLHIAIGAATLVLGPAAMIAKKGGPWHARAGKAYALLMVVTCVTGGLVSVLRGTTAMLTVPLPAFVFVITAYRATKRTTARSDGAVAAALFALCAGICGHAAALWAAGDEGAGANLPIGLWALVCTVIDLVRAARGGLAPAPRMRMHRARMILSYSSTVTAFLQTNVRVLALVTAIAPTAIAVAAIVYLGMRGRRGGRGRPAPAAALQSPR